MLNIIVSSHYPNKNAESASIRKYPNVIDKQSIFDKTFSFFTLNFNVADRPRKRARKTLERIEDDRLSPR